jgi:heme exporter protein D
MGKYFSNPIVITVVSAFLITLITLLVKWIRSIIRTKRIIHYMDITPRTKFRSKYFDSASISVEVNLSKSDVEKLCTKSKKIKKIIGHTESWVLRKNYIDGEEIPPNLRIE